MDRIEPQRTLVRMADVVRAVARAHEKPNGSGLGLAFARRVLEAHGGSLLLRSQPGAGSTVELRLPLRPEP